MDFDDAEKSLRAAVGALRGWSFERFQAIALRSERSVVPGASGLSYLFDIDVTDCSGDYDPNNEWHRTFNLRRSGGAQDY